MKATSILLTGRLPRLSNPACTPIALTEETLPRWRIRGPFGVLIVSSPIIGVHDKNAAVRSIAIRSARRDGGAGAGLRL
jgi:hypothetical protein